MFNRTRRHSMPLTSTLSEQLQRAGFYHQPAVGQLHARNVIAFATHRVVFTGTTAAVWAWLQAS